jgi:hypothetical protein
MRFRFIIRILLHCLALSITQVLPYVRESGGDACGPKIKESSITGPGRPLESITIGEKGFLKQLHRVLRKALFAESYQVMRPLEAGSILSVVKG